jgi:hypothetical protein
MIEIQKNYVIRLTESQARDLYQLLRTEKDVRGGLTTDDDLVLLYHELKKLFDSGIRQGGLNG